MRSLILRCFRRDSKGISDAELQNLSGMKRLSFLNIIRGAELTGAGFQKAGKLTDLRTINLIDCPKVDDDGLKAIAAAAPNLSQLNVSLGNTGADELLITGKGIAALRPLKTLQSLTLRPAKGIDDDALAPLTGFPALRGLEIAGSGVTDKGLKTLLKHKGITYLELSRAQITDEGCADLARMVQLENIELVLTEISDDGLKKLKTLKKLKRLNISQTNTSQEAATELKAEIPGLNVSGP
jgi:hypothetical protein